MINFTKPIKPFWKPEDTPNFLKRTNVEYAKMPIDDILTKRGIENRLLNNLLMYLPKGAIIAGGFMTSVVQNDKQAKETGSYRKRLDRSV